jgi:hypothetical protein
MILEAGKIRNMVLASAQFQVRDWWQKGKQHV